jgi:hypothetical protein
MGHSNRKSKRRIRELKAPKALRPIDWKNGVSYEVGDRVILRGEEVIIVGTGNSEYLPRPD